MSCAAGRCVAILSLFAIVYTGCSNPTRPLDDADLDPEADADADADADGDIDGDIDGDGDADGDASVDAEVEPDSDLMPPCGIFGYDSANPVLRFGTLDPRSPAMLAMARSQIQDAFDNGTINYLLAFDDIAGDGPAIAWLGQGVLADGDGYMFSPEAEPTSLEMEIDGEEFSTTSAGSDLTLSFADLSFGISLELPLRETIVSGTFASSERCSIGEQISDTPPTEWETGGTLDGLLTVDDAREVTVDAMGMEVTLCALMAYGTAFESLLDDPGCTADQESWANPPTGTTSDGAQAWWVIADFAAVAIPLVE